jgi:hypothetical protein
MANDTFDTITRSAGLDRRRPILALGAAGLATTLDGTFGASAQCLAALLPCCDTCDVSTGVVCAINVLTAAT